MKKLIWGFALLVAVCCGVWLAVLWRWQATGHDMTAEDFAIYLVLLPLIVFGLVLALRWAWRGAGARQAARAAAAATGAAAAGGGAASGAAAGNGTARAVGNEEAQRHATAQLLSAHLLCAGGDSPQALLEAGGAGKPLPKLDRLLQNAEGLPVMSARISELALDELKASLPPLQTRLQARLRSGAATAPADSGAAPAAPPLPPDHVQRALAALQVPLLQALQSLRPWEDRFTDAVQPSMIRVLLSCPAWWTDAERQLAEAWARLLLAPEEAGTGDEDGEDAARHDVQAIAAQRFAIDCRALGPVELWAEADRRLQMLRRDRRPDVLLLAACHSDLSDEAIALLESQRRLFLPGQQPKGQIPGEAAAVLVLAPADWPAAPDADKPPVHLHRPALMKRDKAIEAGGSVSSEVLAEVLATALSAARLPTDQVAAVVCDADQHTPRGTELFGATLKALPHLDPAEQLCMTGSITGHGEAGALMVVATAAARAQADQKPCLGLALGDSHWRLALLARPHAAQAAPAAS